MKRACLALDGEAVSVQLDGTLAAVRITGTPRVLGAGYQIVDAFDPFNPRIVAFWPSATFLGYRVSGAKIIEAAGGLNILDFSGCVVPSARMEWYPKPAATGQPVQFRSISGVAPQQWHWDFGDGTASDEENPVHTFSASGFFSAALTVSNPYGISTCRGIADVTALIACPQTLAQWPLPQIPTQFLIEGDIAYLSLKAGSNDQRNRLAIFDLSDPNNLKEIGGCPLPSPAFQLIRSGRYLYVGTARDGVRILDLEEDPGPVEIAAYAQEETVESFILVGPYLYLILDSGGEFVLKVFDITTPSDGFEVYSLPLAVEHIGQILPWQNFLLVSTDWSLLVLDVANPSAPWQVSLLHLQTYAHQRGLFTAGPYIGVASNVEVIILDLSDPLQAVAVGSCALRDIRFVSFAVQKGGLVAIGSDSGLQIISIADPTSPLLTGWVEYGWWGSSLLADLEFWGDSLMVLQSKQMDRLSLEGCVEARISPSADFDWHPAAVYQGADIQFEDHSTGTVTRWWWDFGDGETSQEQTPVHRYWNEGYYAVTLTVSNAYASNSVHKDLRVNPNGCPGLVKELPWYARGSYRSMATHDDYLYLSQGEMNALLILDIRDPLHPLEMATYTESGLMDAIASDGDHLYCGSRRQQEDGSFSWGMAVLDVADPIHPMETAFLDLHDTPSDYAFSNGYLFVARTMAVEILDSADPAHPQPVSTLAMSWEATRLAVKWPYIIIGECLYNAAYLLHIINISDPAHPYEVANIALNAYIREMLVQDNVLYFFQDHQLYIYDISNPSLPIQKNIVQEPGHRHWYSLEIQGSLLLATSDARFYVFNLDDPFNPRILGALRLPNYSGREMLALKDYAFVTNSNGNIQVVDFVQCATLIVQSVGRGTDARGSPWRTDLLLHNPHAAAAHADLAFLQTGLDNSDPPLRSVEIQPGSSLLLEDVILSQFQQSEAAGSLRVRADASLSVQARTYASRAEGGTYGLDSSALDGAVVFREQEEARLVGLMDTADFRSDLGLQNTAETPIQVEADLIAGDGTLLGTFEWELPPWGVALENNLFQRWGSVEDATAALRCHPRGCTFTAYAQLIDRRTGDSSFQPPAATDPLRAAPAPWIIPASAHADGAYGSRWRSDLILHNPGEEDALVSLMFQESGGGALLPAANPIGLGPGQTLSLEDVLLTVFGKEHTSGGLWLDSPSLILAFARIYNEAVSEGIYGLGLPPLTAKDALTQGLEGRLIGLRHDTEFRTNIGVVNGTAAPLDVGIYFYEADGSYLGCRDLLLPGWGYRLESSALYFLGRTVENGYAILISTTSGAVYWAFASVADNHTGDSSFQAATKP